MAAYQHRTVKSPFFRRIANENVDFDIICIIVLQKLHNRSTAFCSITPVAAASRFTIYDASLLTSPLISQRPCLMHAKLTAVSLSFPSFVPPSPKRTAMCEAQLSITFRLRTCRTAPTTGCGRGRLVMPCSIS